MRILIYDNDKNSVEELYTMIKLYPLNTIVDKASDYEDSMEFYKRHNYDKVFIDLSDDIGKKISRKILEINPNQNIYLINSCYPSYNSENCKGNEYCKECKTLKTKKNIIKPIEHKQLGQILSKKFICETANMDPFTFVIEKIKKSTQKRYPYIKIVYDKKESTLKTEQINVQVLVYITNLLSEHNVDYQVLDYDNIKVHSTY